MKKLLALILMIFFVSCDFISSNPQDSWIKSVKGKTFFGSDGINLIFDTNGNAMMKGDLTDDIVGTFGNIIAENIPIIFVNSDKKNYGVYKIKIFFITIFLGMKIEGKVLKITDAASTPDEINWDSDVDTLVFKRK